MAKITKSYEEDIDLTIFTVVGDATFDEIWDQTRIFLSGNPSRLTLCDFTPGTMRAISNQEIKKIAVQGASISDRIEGGRAAILAPNDIDYGMSRVFKIFSQLSTFPLEIEVFRDINSARKWLIPGQ